MKSMKSMKSMRRMRRRQMSMYPQRFAVPPQRYRRHRRMRQDKGRARQASLDRLYAYDVPLAQIGVIVSTPAHFVNEFRAEVTVRNPP
ncbi:hypothetical protein [Burkholderia ambifaria]|uniref:hypothetical protein n=1 Tax=Burkholderia ambifaria TaxID=152480 RepID=UPI00158A2EEB|nr:hypothetical protein [Burkholderia ambifaria]